MAGFKRATVRRYTKATNQAVANQTTTADTTLRFPVVAGGIYHIKGQVYISANTGDQSMIIQRPSDGSSELTGALYQEGTRLTVKPGTNDLVDAGTASVFGTAFTDIDLVLRAETAGDVILAYIDDGVGALPNILAGSHIVVTTVKP